mmetsp:Transcript_1597/g.2180  ORF Transcript_1597/g.2180 Transcript_1597/m.2180 type:complete len:277 (-) Transcript_1597:85-915(-)|eukprot:CAMPEP_0194041868 /NCGR_PEP_ID=MMETSP0009_2-20130614/13679_1 /TAXON_ID=210454 /ORGANISM="Grammatophora oceanica, Strain CCMP 410" /LENGTH=276 /DNA_ID=CAMNT_0038685489 /DNA_START=246 /DNA_END=1076 /DNA_ORIENTATION=-
MSGEKKINADTTFAKPDTVVVVGGKEFQESSIVLRLWSGYFDGAFRSGMEESKTMRFEFPDKKPEDWELFTALLVPFSGAQVTKDNVDAVLDWCDQLCVTRGLAGCDSVLHDTITPLTLIDNKQKMKQIVGNLSRSLRFDLLKTKAVCLELIRGVFKTLPTWLSQEELDATFALIMEYTECREALWGSLQTFCLQAVTDGKEQDTIVRSGTLQMCIFGKVAMNGTSAELTKTQSERNKTKRELQTTKNELMETKRRLARAKECIKEKCENCRYSSL